MHAQPPVQLQRRLGLFETTVSGVGVILGAGIYALVGEAAGVAGNAVWLSFVIAAVMASLTGLSYAELASAYPSAGADYEYARHGLGDRPGFVVGWLMVVSNLVGAAAVALGFGHYLAEFVDINPTWLAVIVVLASTLLAFAGVREAIWASIALTFIEAGGLLFVILVGIPRLGDFDLIAGPGPGALLSGAALVTFAYVGFSQVAALAEETIDAPRVIPRAILFSIAITATLYVLVAIAAISAVGAEALASSDAPLALVASRVVGESSGDFIAVVALFSTANTVLLLLMASSRMVYGMASGDRAALPRFMAWVHPVVHTPARAIMACLVVALGFTLSGDLRFVAGASNFAVFVAFSGVNLSLILLRYRQPGLERPFRVPWNIRGFPLLPGLALVGVASLLVSLDADALIAGAILFAFGVLAAQLLRLWERPR